ncbi:MAG: sugar ABC transporter substrate-binding protein [Candidatus Margulisbacteria bacterium]|nr:sugar ABC transporter substrate-binding protein [Candidatus Margulisiibacteriota bacterium]MBU1617196.1 sugar ABC transporter substrate-binding protein [Candidatus Margulisiibacteriota bacterium]MBU1866968.1 sugar ABC transporter substrate-binding protein [Candidatus Margulisiibacteriota bacterium]
MKLRTMFLLVLFGSLLLVVGCAPSKTTSNERVVEFWVMPNSLSPVADIENLLAPFEKKTGIKVKVTSVDWGAAWSKITTAATSGDVPDMVQLGSTWTSAIAKMGALETFSKEAISSLGGSKSFVPVAWQTTGIEKSGQVSAIPWFVDARALFIRTDAFKKAGLNPSELQTWDGFRKGLKKLYEADLVFDDQPMAPLGISGKNDWNVIHSLAPWIWMAGGDFLSADRKTCVLDSDAAAAGIVYYLNLVKEGYVPISYLELNTAQVSANFNSGACASYFDGPYEVKTLTRPASEGGAGGSPAAKNFAVIGYPKGPKGRMTFVGGSSLAVFKQGKNKADALKVIQYLTSLKPQVEYAKVTGFLPARIEAFKDPFISNDPNLKVFKEAVFYGRTYPAIPAWGLLEPILTRRLGIMWDQATADNNYDPARIKKQLKLAKKEVESILNQQQ